MPVLGEHDDAQHELIRYLIACPQCDQPLLVERWWENVDGVMQFDETHLLWPNGTPVLPNGTPPLVWRSFLDAHRALERRQSAAAALSARRCLEVVAVDLGATDFMLSAKLRTLAAGGTFSAEMAVWATAIIDIGNDAAHPERAGFLSERAAEDAVALLDALVGIIYVTRPRFKRFKRSS